MNNAGRIVLMLCAALFMSVSFYVFVDWLELLSHNRQSANVPEDAAMWLLTVFTISFLLGIVSFLAYRHSRKLEEF